MSQKVIVIISVVVITIIIVVIIIVTFLIKLYYIDSFMYQVSSPKRKFYFSPLLSLYLLISH